MTMNIPDPPAYVVVLASGGLDSTTLAYHLRDMGAKARLLSFDYGQRHARELECASPEVRPSDCRRSADLWRPVRPASRAPGSAWQWSAGRSRAGRPRLRSVAHGLEIEVYMPRVTWETTQRLVA